MKNNFWKKQKLFWSAFKDFFLMSALIIVPMTALTYGVISSINDGRAVRPWAGILGLIILSVSFALGLTRPFIYGYRQYVCAE
jgi:hypothetical protein